VAVLGSTGSIGTSTLDVIAASAGRFAAFLLAAHRNVEQLVEQARACRPKWVVVIDPDAATAIDASELPSGTRLAAGPEALDELMHCPEIDRVVSAIVGAAGLRSTWAALEAGKTVALANKETLVMAGPLVTELAARTGGRIVPVDSEHSAIHQALRSGTPAEVARIVLTASGGPFRKRPVETLSSVSREEALRHPTWSMGPKITIDSATMMNKALELIEARWLFGLPGEKLDVVIHPQSIVHSMVEFVDGSVVAQLSPPDMRLPIQYALAYPERLPCPAPKFDFTRNITLEFEPPDPRRFPAVCLGHEAAVRGGTCGAVLNAANEEAVRGFLEGELRFSDIAEICRRVLDEHPYSPEPSLDEVRRLDGWARQEVMKWACV
jgi:1-deoxy-D-xylulose-5-phosphate reductoisomerase